jgi:hypothetical protein
MQSCKHQSLPTTKKRNRRVKMCIAKRPCRVRAPKWTCQSSCNLLQIFFCLKNHEYGMDQVLIARHSYPIHRSCTSCRKASVSLRAIFRGRYVKALFQGRAERILKRVGSYVGMSSVSCEADMVQRLHTAMHAGEQKIQALIGAPRRYIALAVDGLSRSTLHVPSLQCSLE